MENTILKATKSRAGNKTYYLIIGNPTPGSFGDYLLLKNHYKKLDKDHDWRYKVAFNIRFLRSQKQKYGTLTCCFCGKEHLIIEAPSGKKISQRQKATVDHFIPPSCGGGEFDTNNFVVSCGKCNGRKGRQIYDTDTLKFSPTEEKRKIENYIETINIIYF